MTVAGFAMNMITVAALLLLVLPYSANAVEKSQFDRNLQIVREIPRDLSRVKGYEAELSEFNPFAADAEKSLEDFDKAYQRETGDFFIDLDVFNQRFADCYRESCPVFAYVSLAEQVLTLYLNGQSVDRWLVSSGMPGYDTPQLDRHPTSRIYTRYSSKKFPGGNYQGLGNMPYAVFIAGGIAIHGTPRGNWRWLGRPASHGCIRLHPAHAEAFNRLVRENGSANVWVLIY